MSLLSALANVRQQSFVFEVTQSCNHDCLHCYNAWKNSCPYPAGGELPTCDTLDILGRMIDQTGATLVSLSGGEPMLRPDIFDIVDYLVDRRRTVNLISNGSLLDDAAIARLVPNKVSIFELPLLSVERAIHDRMSCSAGGFDKTTLAIASLKAAGQRVVAVFVATKLNLATWTQTAELAIALGVDGIMFNRFNPGGTGWRNVELLQPGVDELSAALAEADALSGRYGISISCSIAMPPCLFETKRYPRLGFGFCAAGTSRAYYTLDPLGNVRPCNHSTTILGNIREASFASMARGELMRRFMSARPAECAGCRLETTCQGGCKAAAEVCFGDASVCDPFLRANLARAQRFVVCP